MARITGLAAAVLGGVVVARLFSERWERRRGRSWASVARPPDRYRESWAMWVERRTPYEDIVDEASDQSFPASDPPGYTASSGLGAPRE